MYGYDMEIDVGVLFRRMYCCKCGTKLKRTSISRLVKKGELGHDEHLVPMRVAIYTYSPQIKVRYVYICPKCKQVTTYEQQCQIAKRQRKAKTKILEEKE